MKRKYKVMSERWVERLGNELADAEYQPFKYRKDGEFKCKSTREMSSSMQ